MNKDYIELRYNRETGYWEEKPEPYAIVECESKDDYDALVQTLLREKSRGEERLELSRQLDILKYQVRTALARAPEKAELEEARQYYSDGIAKDLFSAAAEEYAETAVKAIDAILALERSAKDIPGQTGG